MISCTNRNTGIDEHAAKIGAIVSARNVQCRVAVTVGRVDVRFVQKTLKTLLSVEMTPMFGQKKMLPKTFFNNFFKQI